SRQEVGHVEGGAGTVGAIDGRDVRRGQVDARVQLLDLRVVPLRDLPEVDVGDHAAGQVQVVLDARQVVEDGRGGQRPRHHDAATAVRELVDGRRRVGGPEVDRAAADRGDARAGPDRVVGDRRVLVP